MDHFISRVQLHGLQDVYLSKPILLKYFWVCILFTMIGGLLQNLFTACSEYSKGAVITSTTVTASRRITFPDIALCPQILLDYPRIEADFKEDWKQVVKYLMEIRAVSNGHWDDFEERKKLRGMFVDTQLKKAFGRMRVDGLSRVIKNYSLPVRDIMLKCNVMDTTVNCSDVTEKALFDGLDHFCYTIRPRQQQTHPDSGLWIEMSIPDGYDTNFGYLPLSGVSVMIDYVLPGTNVVFVQAGHRSRIDLSVSGLEMKCTTQQPCLSYESTVKFRYHIFNVTYRPKLCRRDCKLWSVWETCGCLLFEDSVNLQDRYQNASVCTGRDVMRCRSQHERHWRAIGRKCQRRCVYSCSRQILQARENAIAFSTAHSRYNVNRQGSDDEIFMKNISQAVVLEIMFGEMVITNSTQRDAVSFNMFISNVGGLLGLWVGGSLLALVQLIVHSVEGALGFLRSKKVLEIDGKAGVKEKVDCNSGRRIFMLENDQ